MEAKELRIGNLLLSVKTGKIIKVDWLVMKHIQDGNQQLPPYDMTEVYKPIELTKEWLLKFGFEVKYLTIEKKINSDFTFIFIPSTKDGYHFMPHVTLKWGVDLKYVHQLQNLFFALIGEDLIINE